MKRIFIILLFLTNLSICFAYEVDSKVEVALQDKSKKVAEVESQIEVVDEIKARVNGVNITKSFVEKPQAVMGGQKLSLEAAINTELLFQKARERKLLPTVAEINRQIANLKISNGIAHLTDEELEKELKQEGLTFSEYKGQIAKYIAVERLKAAEFSERVVVTKQEIKDFYEKNPSWSTEKYCINICELTFDDVDEDGNLKSKDINKTVKNKEWDDLGWILKKDLNSNLDFVSNMKTGQISKPVKIGDTYHLVKLVDRAEKFLKTLDDRYSEIESKLQFQKRAEFEQVFENELRSDASIVYLV